MSSENKPITIWQDTPHARWMCPVANDATDNDPWSGYIDVDADARTGTVVVSGMTLTPDEARQYAQAVMSAADHAEQFHQRAADTLWNLICHWPELNDLPTEVHRDVRERLRVAEMQVRQGRVWRGETVTVTSEIDGQATS